MVHGVTPGVSHTRNTLVWVQNLKGVPKDTLRRSLTSPCLFYFLPAVLDGHRIHWENPWADLSWVRWHRELHVSPSGLCGGCSFLQTSASPSTGRSAPRTDAQHVVWKKQTHHISDRRNTLLSVHPHLQRQHHQSHADHDDHQQLGGPYPRGHVPKADGGEGDNAEVERVEERKVFACTLQVLDPACAVLPEMTPVHY